MDVILKSLMLLLLLVAGCKAERKKADLRRIEQAKLRRIGLAAESYHLSNPEYPSSLTALAKHDPEFRSAFGSVTVDEWGTPVRYTVSGDNFTVESGGPDGKFGTADDMIFRREDIEGGEDWEKKQKQRRGND